MRVKHSYLYWGVFLVAIGGAVLVIDRMPIDESRIVDLLRLWPAVIVAIGVALVLRRTRFSLAGGMLAAALPGLVLGGMLAVGPRIAWDCAPGAGQPASFITRDGSFSAPARVDVTTGCGSLTITTRSGAGWTLEAGNTRGETPDLDTSPTGLSVGRDDHRSGWFGFHGRDVWRLALPTTALAALEVNVNSGDSRTELPGADIGSLGYTTNAGRSVVDLTDAAIETFRASVNAGEFSVDLPAGDDFSGEVTVNAGSARICVPDGLGVRVHGSGALNSTDYGDLVQNGTTWQSPDYASAAHHADLTFSVNVGNLEFDSMGGCR
jgi:hypothetical protein